MKGSERRDAMALLGVVGALLAAVVVSESGRWLDAGSALARSPLVPVLAGIMAVAVVAVLLLRAIASRRALDRRVRVVLIPADGFDPDPEAVIRFAAGLARARRLGDLLSARAHAVRVLLDTDPGGRLRYVVELPEHARPALRAALAGYADVELHDAAAADQSEPAGEGGEGEVARVELVLARASVEPLRDAGIDPDPLAGIARALAGLRPEDETAIVCADLLPTTPARRRRLRRRMLRDARRRHRDERADPLDGLLGGERGARGRAAPAELVARRSGQRALSDKLGSPEPLFEIQLLLRTTSPIRGRAVLRLEALMAAFDVFAGENHFRAAGLRLPGGRVFLGADAPWRRARFDRRARTGLFAPARRRIVTATEIAGLLKPPTASCKASNVLRSGGTIPPAPRQLPAFTTDRAELLPLGRVNDEDGGERTVGLPLDGSFFTYMAGRSRYGKTETGIGMFVHLARSGHGCFFLDPHEDAIERIGHYLPAADRDRLVRIDFSHPGEQQVGWNLFAPAARPAQQQVDAVVDAFASALRWDEINARALNLTTQATQALLDLARVLPVDAAPTIFQIPTLLGDDDWRAAVLPHVSPATRQFFTDRFPRLSAEAITPVTNLIDRLRVSPQIATVLGNSRSDYDVRAAMDAGKIVLACPGAGTTTRDRLIANFLVYDVLHAAKTRAGIDPAKRRPFFVFLDEVQVYDGASSGNLAALLEQTAKYGVRAFLFNQNPERLTPATLNAVTTNRSHLLTTTLNARGAATLGREFAGQIEPEVLTRLERYTFVASVTLDGAATPPFLVHGIPAHDLFDHTDQPLAPPAVGAPVTDTLAALDTLDRRILDQLRGPGHEVPRARSRRPA